MVLVLAVGGYATHNWLRSPASKRREAQAMCRAAYTKSRTKGDSLLADAIVVTPASSKTPTQNETCAELRLRKEI